MIQLVTKLEGRSKIPIEFLKNILEIGSIYAYISREAEDVALGGDVVKVEACIQPSHLGEHAEVL